MSLLELLYIGQSYRSNRRGLRLPLLLGRLHLGLIFCGNSSCNSSRKSSTDNGALRSFLFIATLLITKCGSSTFPNREKQIEVSNLSAVTVPSSTTRPTLAYVLLAHQDDDQDFPLDLVLSQKIKSSSVDRSTNGNVRFLKENETTQHVKTLGYFLKGLVLPMLISLTLSFGFVIYKNRAKRARLQAIQDSLERERMNPNQLPPHQQAIMGGLVNNALLSVIDARGEWSLISGGNFMEGDDYVGEGGETARRMPLPYDKPPDYATVFDPPSYEEATSSVCKSKSKIGVDRDDEQLSSLLNCSGYRYDDDCDDDEKQLVDGFRSLEQ